jgi:hypothetical protein
MIFGIYTTVEMSGCFWLKRIHGEGGGGITDLLHSKPVSNESAQVGVRKTPKKEKKR